ncbi:hypothetical protein B9Z55_022651 [Caenorhabditis nigoni]|nr:hypothetical protein B9Z55_022651 [Caenorhabditis nigoni]
MEVEIGPIIGVYAPRDISQNIGVPAQPEHIVYEFQDRPIEYQNDDDENAPGPIRLRRVRTTRAEVGEILGTFVGTHDTGFVNKYQHQRYRVYDPRTREPLKLPFNGSTNMSDWTRSQVQEFLSQIVSPHKAQAIGRLCLDEIELLLFEPKTSQFYAQLIPLMILQNQYLEWHEYEQISKEVAKVRRVQLGRN